LQAIVWRSSDPTGVGGPVPASRYQGVFVDLLLLSAAGIVALALLFDFSNGFHDAANSIATVVATGAMSARKAVLFSAACNFAAYFFVGTAVASTVAKIVDAGDEGTAVVFAGLFAAIAWNYMTWYVGMPSSSSHAIIGGLVGAGIASGGLDVVNWQSVRKTVSAIFLSPAVAFGVAVVGTLLVVIIQLITRWKNDASPFKGIQLLSAAAVSLGHGANDAQKTMGVIAALLASSGYVTVESGHAIPVPWWVGFSAYSAIALGTMWGGWRIIETMGMRLTKLDARTGVAANIGATTAIFGATHLGIPISTTHAAASSVIGAGVAGRRGANFRVVGQMAIAWIVTMPATALVGWLVFQLTELPTPLAVIGVTLMLALLLGTIAWAMVNASGEHHRAEQAQEAARVQEAAQPLAQERETFGDEAHEVLLPENLDLSDGVNLSRNTDRPAVPNGASSAARRGAPRKDRTPAA
jgi:inorganic phosphate transporter, PiT family